MKFLSIAAFIAIATPASAALRGQRHNPQRRALKKKMTPPMAKSSLLALDNRPKGLAHAAMNSIYVSQLLTGAVSKVDTKSGKQKLVVPPHADRLAVGIETYNDALLVAGGGTILGVSGPAFHAYSTKDGTSLAHCQPDSALFINDVAVIGNYAYFTCSKAPLLIRANADDLLEGHCNFDRLLFPQQYSDDFTTPTDTRDFAGTGIVHFLDGLLIANAKTGGIYFFKPDQNTLSRVTHSDTFSPLVVPNIDGIEVHGPYVYVTAEDTAYMYSMNAESLSVTLTTTITDPTFSTLSSVLADNERDLYIADVATSVAASADDSSGGSFYVHKLEFPAQPSSIIVNNLPKGLALGNGDSVYVSQLLTGGVSEIDTKSGAEKIIVPPQANRVALGIETYKNALLVAGGGMDLGVPHPAFYAYSINDGTTLATCEPSTALFINDVAVIGKYAYFTCSKAALIIKADVEKLVAGQCDFERLLFPEEYAGDFSIPMDSDEFGATGVVDFMGGLLIANAKTGGIYFFMPEMNVLFRINNADTGGPLAVYGIDGIEVHGTDMYVTAGVTLYKYSMDVRNHSVLPKKAISGASFGVLSSVVADGKELLVADLGGTTVGDADETGVTGPFKVHKVEL